MEIKEEETALSQIIDDDDVDFSQMGFDEPMDEPTQPTQKIEDSEDEVEKVEEKENLEQNHRGFKTIKKEEVVEVKAEMQPAGKLVYFTFKVLLRSYEPWKSAH